MLRVITNLYAERVATAHAPTYNHTSHQFYRLDSPHAAAMAAREDHPPQMHAKRRTFVYVRVLLVRRAKKVVFSCAFGTGPSGVPAVLVRAHVFRVRS